AGSCDVAEVCLGDAGLCPGDIMSCVGATYCAGDAGCVATLGNGSGCGAGNQCASGFCVSGLCCDKACTGSCEACNQTGSVGTCSMLPASTVCRAQNGFCDVAEFCSGTASTCPADAVRPVTTQCRGSVGVCDVAEFCDGATSAC